MRVLTGLATVAALSMTVLYHWSADPGEPASVSEPSPVFPVDAAEAFTDPPTEWEYRFPADHGSHPEQFGEYWWLAGQLHDDAGGARAFQLAIYRLALSRERPDTDSRWGTRDLFRGQFPLDPAPSDGLHAEEGFGRDAVGLGACGEAPQPVAAPERFMIAEPGPIPVTEWQPGDPAAGFRILVNRSYVTCRIPLDALRSRDRLAVME